VAFADMVVAKLDAHEETLFHAINRPAEGISQAKILQSLQMFRIEYQGTIAVDIMLCDLNKEYAYYLQYAAKCIVPDQVQLNTPLRPCAIKPLPVAEIEAFRKNWFWNHKNVKTAYDNKRFDVVPLDIEETELRHPTKPKSSPVNACSATTC
jgi:wyosine [tRNA(Phe)-imidazoG37] synthetase (radical SAM superfamily)